MSLACLAESGVVISSSIGDVLSFSPSFFLAHSLLPSSSVHSNSYRDVLWQRDTEQTQSTVIASLDIILDIIL